ncbi:hypothetical protein PYV61_23510, partial [Roseisolibacter sp. H3M3-2]
MAVGEGKFVLYSKIEPPLEAGDYRLTARQELAASGPDGALGADDLKVAPLPTHLRVRAPRFQLPPDQVLSTFPPANTEGAYGMRLPQVVIKRRTLPWERLLGPSLRGTPWLALVLVAEGEAELKPNQPVGECITSGVTLDGAPDVEVGNTLIVRRSVVHRIFPTRKDVPLLAHAREVDIHDTELMMGDDDGFLAVVVSNRLPLAGRDAAGNEAPVKYLACLVNLEGQFDRLLPEAPPPRAFTLPPLVLERATLELAAYDRITMGAAPAVAGIASSIAGATAPFDGTVVAPLAPTHAAVANTSAVAGTGFSRADATKHASADVYLEMARPFGKAGRPDVSIPFDPVYRFPVLLHWSFTSVGSLTFETLMRTVDSGLLGTVPPEPPADAKPEAGRPPLEVVETGHVGLAHRTRRGDSARIWYRGPLVPHPTEDPPEGRLPLAHAADQLRIVIPDGREDLSLAGAFEVGRLMALARPSIVAALLRWRQLHYQTARRQAIWDARRAFLEALLGNALPTRVPVDFGVQLGRALATGIAARPAAFVGPPRPLVDAGRPLAVDGTAAQVLAAAYALPPSTFKGDMPAVLGQLRATAPVVANGAGGSPIGLTNRATAAAARAAAH